MEFQTLEVRFQNPICFIMFNRNQDKNTITDQLIEEFSHVLQMCEKDVTVVVIGGSSEYFCFGADFKGVESSIKNPEPLYELWLRIASGPYITIAHVQGRVNAGGIGFVAACDIVISNETALFSLSELIFGLLPACVLPFLIRRVGFQKANYMTLMTHPITVQQAHIWNLVDAYESQSAILLRKHLLRLKHLSKTGVQRYKGYSTELYDALHKCKPLAIKANQEVFSDSGNLELLNRFIEKGLFPWEVE
ncbi:enoyl-CoA hydratase/isomerase [Paenibacillus alba]|uniref:enoyl-CoA hydratase/isomerase n=1 Tax=Paenibacillus alba TaxID=1197127 RepID=UPI001567C5AC|nr:enoyl-CoA hydratase/isomerase [Paenibacillus alba]NQX71870.1 enoyl-CoA hydratase/isomerase [Paenibacillus alba]